MGLTRWFRRRPSDDEMREELEAHVAMRAEHDGVDEAAARRRLGNVLRTREAMRRIWIAEWWEALRQDTHFTWRSWRRRPAFAIAAILVLALGLGASTALFAALDRMLFRPLPYADPNRIVSVGLRPTSQDGSVLNQGDARHGGRDRLLAGDRRVPRRRPRWPAIRGNFFVGRETAGSFRPGDDPDRADAGAARRLRAVASLCGTW